LTLLKGAKPDDLARSCLEASLVLYADLAFNASTLACRVCASTGSDLDSCLTAGIATLRGPLHGGASVAVKELLDRFTTPDEARMEARGMLNRRERLAGFGHAVYKNIDPRTAILKCWAIRLADVTGDHTLIEIARAIEQVMSEEKRLFANVDFYTACCYQMMAIPTPLFSPLFVCARTAGWSAQVAEQRSQKSLIHPSAEYTGPELRAFEPIDQRSPG
jgi:2-methylcitrate synthase